jgi:hypothetical protein
MTDRESMAPADLNGPPNFIPQTNPLVCDLSLNSHLESAPRGDCSPMSLTFVPRPPSRLSGTDGQSVDPVRAWLAQISSNTPNLSAFPPVILPDSHNRTPAESFAAARAAGCPDLFIVHASDSTVRERIIADLTWVTATERVLVLSPDPTTADRIVDRLVKAEIDVVRALAEDENPVRSSSVVARATSVALVAARQERLKQDAATAVAGATARLMSLANTASRYTQLAEFNARRKSLDAEIVEVNVQRDLIERQVRLEAAGTEVTAFTSLMDQRRTEHKTTVDLILQKRIAAQTVHKEKEALLAELRKQTIEAGKKSGFFSRLLGKSKSTIDSTELEKLFHQAETQLQEVATAISALQHDMDVMAVQLQDEREKLIQAETKLRQVDIDSQLTRLTSESDQLRTEIESITRALGPNPSTTTELAELREAAERELESAKQRAAEVDRTAALLVKRDLVESRVVVGTPGSLLSDPVFDRDSQDLNAEPQFNLLVLDRAEELTEHDFVRLAKLGERWVLVGEVAAPEEPRPQLKMKSTRPGNGFSRNGRVIEIPFAARLAQLLDREKWAFESDRLVCRLEHLNPDAKRGLAREPLLDCPEIELRFTTNTNGEPVLVEVAFPLATTIAAAKSFLYHQLSVVLLRPCGAVSWHSTPTTITAAWVAVDRDAGGTKTSWIDLEVGVREKVVGVGLAAFTAAIAFDTTAGWNIEKAEMWLNEHLPTESPGRFLTVPHR